jgi:cyclic lactone autoinducer peptide
MKKKALHLLATIIGCTGLVVVCTASWIWGNQPKVPAELLKK